MADSDDLLAGFRAELEAGRDPDPGEWIARAEGAARQELAAAIDRLLMTPPRRAWDPAAFEASLAKLAVDRVYESLEGVSGSWPETLPQLRNRAQIRRSELVDRLAGALGVAGDASQLERVGAYYHRMEHGLLPAAGVSERVLVALAKIVGTSAEVLRSSGARTTHAAGEVGDIAFARMADPLLDEARAYRSAELSTDQSFPPGRDEIDELFTGG